MQLTQISHSLYRPDIDGLRAFAVLSVVLFHAFPEFLPGGYSGVDVFFVISGFLISGNIWRDLRGNRFSFLDFYARRIRRIFPTLILVLLACLLGGWFLLFADEFKQLGNHAMRAAAFLSNFALWRESGYFDVRAELKPLLHLWSLAIEEQFYIVWPLVLLFVWRFTTRPLTVLVTLFGVSFGWNLHISQVDPIHDFYSPLTRFWELILGSMLAVAALQSPVAPSLLWRRVLAWLGLAFLLTGIVRLDNHLSYPAGWALLPTLGAAMVLWAKGADPFIENFLTHRLSLWVGRISYALYLWHWPFFSFARILEGQTPSLSIRCLCILLAFVMAYLSTRYVEFYFRNPIHSRIKVVILTSLMALVGTLGYFINQTKGFPQRSIHHESIVMHPGEIGHDAFHQAFINTYFQCQDSRLLKDAGDWKGIKRCFQSHIDRPIQMVLLGDSHAEHLYLGLAKQLPNTNLAYYGKGALPSIHHPQYQVIFDALLSDRNVNTVLLNALWHGRMKEPTPGFEFESEMIDTIQALMRAGKKVVLIDDIFYFDFDPQRCKFVRPLGAATLCEYPRHLADQQAGVYMDALKRIVSQSGASGLIEIRDVLCNAQSCAMVSGDTMAYRDNNHLSVHGSWVVGQSVAKQLRDLKLGFEPPP